MSLPQNDPPKHPDCCRTHDGPHVRGCVIPRQGERTHDGACLLAVTA